MMGHTLELPVVAPSSAPPEDKKLILTQTRDRIAEVSPGDWPAKTHLLAQRFIVSVPNAANEAKVRLYKLKDWASDVFVYSPPIGLQGNLNFTDLANTQTLRYLSLEIHVQPRNAPTIELPVPGLPGERTIEAIVKIPLNALGTDVHPICTPQNLMNPKTLFRDMKQVGIEVQMGKRSSANTFDPAAFDKEFRDILSECMFSAVEAILNRDYIGKGITQDIQKRLRDCRQVIFHQGRYRVKTVTEQHADFMRLVQEFDVDEHIPANLPNIAFHNLAKNIQAEMINQKYEPPTECHTTAEQYQKLAEFHEKALEAETKLNQMETLVKRFSGANRNNNATAFMAKITPEDAFLANDGDDAWIENPYEGKMMEITNQNAQLKTMLSVAERAIRRASGELAPIECWGCKDLPEYSEDKFHRYRFCPRRNDPRVKANFDRNLREWTSKKRQGQPFRTQELGSQYKSQKFEPTAKRTHLTLPSTLEQGNTHQADNDIQDITQQLGQVSAETDLLMEFGISRETDLTPTRLPVNTTRVIKNPKPKEDKENISPSTKTTEENKYTPDWADNWNESLPTHKTNTGCPKWMATGKEARQNFLLRYAGKQQLPTPRSDAEKGNTSSVPDESIRTAIILCNLKTTAPTPTTINEKLRQTNSHLKDHTHHTKGQNPAITTQSFRVTQNHNSPSDYSSSVLNQPLRTPTLFPTDKNKKAPPCPNGETCSTYPALQKNSPQIHREHRKKNLSTSCQPEEETIAGTRTKSLNPTQKSKTTHPTKNKPNDHNFSLPDRTKLCPRNRKMKLFCPANMSVPRGPYNEPRLLNAPPRFPTVNPPSGPNEVVTDVLNEWRSESNQSPPRETEAPDPQDLSTENPEDSEAIKDLVSEALTTPDKNTPEDTEWREIFRNLQEDNTPVTSLAGSEDLAKGTGMKPDIGERTYTAPDLECKEWRALATEAVKFQITAIGEILVAETHIEPGITAPLALIAHPLSEDEEGMAILPAKGETHLFMASLEDHILRGSLGFEVNNIEAARDVVQLLIKHGYLDGLADADLWCHTGHGLLRLSDFELEMAPNDLLSQQYWDIRWAMFEGSLLQEGTCNIEVAMLKSPEEPDCSAGAALRRIRARNKLDLEDMSTCGQTLRAAITDLTEEPDIKERVKAVLPFRPATKCMVTKLTSNRKSPPYETTSTDESKKSGYESEDSTHEAMKKLANNEVPNTLWKHEPRHLAPRYYNHATDTHTYRYTPTPPNCHTHFHLPPGYPVPQIQQLHPLGTWSFPHIFGYSHETESPEEIELQRELAREKDEEFDQMFDEEFDLAQFLVLDKADRGNQEVSAIEEDTAHLLLNWNMAKIKEDMYRKLIGNDYLPAAERIITLFESGPNPTLGENYVGTTPLLIPFDISPASWTQMKRAHRITQADLCLAVNQITQSTPFLFTDVIKARKIRDWRRAQSAVDMLSEALKNAGYAPILAKTCLQEFSKSLGTRNFIGQLRVFNTTLVPDIAISNQNHSLLQLSEQAKQTPTNASTKFGRQALDQSREDHLENLKTLSATWNTGPGNLDYVKVAVKFGTESLPLFFLLDNGSPKSILNLKTIQRSARKSEGFHRLVEYVKTNAKEIPVLRHHAGWEIKSAIPLRITWHEYNSEDYGRDSADDVVEPFGIAESIPDISCHGIIGRDFLQRFYATYAVSDSANASLITIYPYWGRAISTTSTEPTPEEILNPTTKRDNSSRNSTISSEPTTPLLDTTHIPEEIMTRPLDRKAPLGTHIKPHESKKYVSIWNGRSWKKEAQLLKAHKIRIVDQAVFTTIPPALSESQWDHTKPRDVYTLPSRVTVEPMDYALIDTDFAVNNETPATAIIVLKLARDPQSQCSICPKPKPLQQVTGAFVTTRNGLRWLMVKIRNNSNLPWVASQKLIGSAEIWQAPDRKSWQKDIADGERRTKALRQNAGIEPQISDDENYSHICVYKKPKKSEKRPPTPFHFTPAQAGIMVEDLMSYTTEPSHGSSEYVPNQTDTSDTTSASESTAAQSTNRFTPSMEDNMDTESESESGTINPSSTPKLLTIGISRTQETGYSRTTNSLQITPQPTSQKKRKHPRTSACLGFIRVNQSVLKKKIFPVATTEMLPHILFPVGEAEPGSPWQNLTTIRGLLDTGSGVNIGYKPYWESVAAHYPELIKEFGQLDPDDHEELTVGGIEKSGEGTSCSHFIILKTPFVENGSPIELRIALTDGLSCNLIFGLPFIVKSKMIINVWEKFVVSPVFQASFPLLYHPPELRESVIAQDGTTPVLKASSSDE
jgi:hypothetical protein